MTAIPAPVQAVLDLFAGELQGVRFADVDGARLKELAQGAEAAASELAARQAALDTAKEALAEAQEALLQQVQRAVAYARVYAENDPALAERIGAIALPRPGKPTRTKASAARSISAGTSLKGSAEAASEQDASARDEQGSAAPAKKPRKASVEADSGDDTVAASAEAEDVPVPAERRGKRKGARSVEIDTSS